MSLYRKYRPQSFFEILGQPQVSEPLLKQLETGKISHAYLFSGPRGTGKTSTARIFAKAVNCREYGGKIFGEPCNKCVNCEAITQGRYLDVLEIDAASNRGIDEIRDLREKIRLAPTTGKFKVYIIDEVHMLTNEAFNALLKTLEEPPEHAIFILATTEPHKLPATVISRTQRFDFNRPSVEQIKTKLNKILEAESWSISDEGLAEIARTASGTFRDAEVLLDKISAVNHKASLSEVQKLLGKEVSGNEVDLLNLILIKKTKEAVIWLDNYVQNGGNPKVLAESIVETLRDILLIKVGAKNENNLSYPPETTKNLITVSNQISREKLTRWIELFSTAISDIKDSSIPQLPLELAFVEACEFNEGLEVNEAGSPTATMDQKEEVLETKEEAVPITDELKTEIKEKEEVGKFVEKSQSVRKTKDTRMSPMRVESLQERWSEILRKVKPHNNSLEIFLRGAVPVSIEESLITLEVGYGFHKDRLEEPKNNDVLADVFSGVLGRPVRIKVVVGQKKEKPKMEMADSDPLDEADPVEVFGKLV